MTKIKLIIEIKIEIDQLRKQLVFLFAEANAFDFEIKSKEYCYYAYSKRYYNC